MSAAGVRSDLWAEFIETREQKLREELITEYASLVRFVVGRLGIPPTSLLEIDDLVSYGMIGLINAIDRFDLARGVPFEAFATPRIRGAVIDHLRSLNWQPRSAVSRIRQVEAASGKRGATHGPASKRRRGGKRTWRIGGALSTDIAGLEHNGSLS